MSKRIGQTLALMGMLTILWIGAGREKPSGKEERSYEEMISKKEQEEAEKKKEEKDYEKVFELLNKNLLDINYEGEEEMLIPGKEEMLEYGLEVKGEFTPVVYENSIFPSELVLKLQESIYPSLNEYIEMHFYDIEFDEKDPYERLKKELGGEKFELDLQRVYELFPELKGEEQKIKHEFDAYKIITGEERCSNLVHIPREEGEDYYVIVINNGGTNGAVTVKLTYRREEGFETICEFHNPNAGFGTVIEYEGEYYYIYLHRNYNLKNYDGYVLHRLGERAREETLKVCYWPKEYKWKNYYKREENKELEDYIEEIKGEITTEKYLENGMATDIGIYYGKENLDPDFPQVDEWRKKYYKIDFGNIGIPIHMGKTNFIPSNYRTCWHLTVRFFIEDPIQENIRELEEMRIAEAVPDMYEFKIVQMWFQEIGGKVFTFQIYHYRDYNYMLHVTLIEGDKVTQVRTDIFSPERGFIVTEGEIFNAYI